MNDIDQNGPAGVDDEPTPLKFRVESAKSVMQYTTADEETVRDLFSIPESVSLSEPPKKKTIYPYLSMSEMTPPKT